MVKKKILVVFMLITLLVSLMPIISNAADNVNFSVSSASGSNGSEVTISVDMNNSANFASANMTLSYDDSKLEYVSYEKGSVLDEGAFNALINPNTSGKITIGYIADPSLTDQTKQAGNVIKVVFKIKDSASGKADLTFTCSSIKQKDGTPLTTNIQNGTVTIIKALTNVTLDKTELTLNEGATDTLTATYTPADTTDDTTATWISSDTNVATVNNGNITAIKAGTSVITVKIGEFTATCNLTVLAPMTGITLNKTKTTISKGKTETLKISYIPDNTTDDKTAIWTSSSEAIATVDNGVVTGIAEGTATITAKVGTFEASCEVTVKEIPLKTIELDTTDIELGIKDTYELTILYNPADTTDDKTAIWTSSEEAIATVNNGVVTGVAEGTAIITAKVGEKTATAKVTVTKKVEAEEKTNEAETVVTETSEEEPKNDIVSNILPKTGDIAIYGFILLAIVSGAGIFLYIKSKNKTK